MPLSSAFKPITIALFLAYSAFSQALIPITFSPPSLIVGSGPISLNISSGPFPSDARVRWNGADRAETVTASGTLPPLQLTATDLAAPGLGEITVYEPVTGATLAEGYIGIGYNVVPVGIVYDSTRKRFYLTTPPNSKDPRFPSSSVVAFDPETGAVGPSYTTTTYLGQVALSSDSSLLYVIGEGDNIVRILDPQTLAIRSTFSFRGQAGTAPFGFGYLSSIAVMPGQPNTVAINYAPAFGSASASLGIFDNGVKRAKEGAPTGPGVVFSSDGKYIFIQGFNGSQYGVMRLSVDNTGTPAQSALIGGTGIPLAVTNGTLFTSTGMMLDGTSMLLSGNLDVTGSIAVDAINQRILALLPGNPETLQAFDLASQEPLGFIPLPGIDGSVAAPLSPYRNLVRFGVDGVIYPSVTTLVPFHTALAGPSPVSSANAIVNAASSTAGAIAPGELLTIYGQNLGPPQPVSATLGRYVPVPASLSDVQVWFDDLPGRVLLAYQGQINVVAPFELQLGSNVDVQVWNFGIPSARIPMPVVAAAPGLFTRDSSGKGLAAVINQDGSVNAPSAPGSYATLFGTGAGPTQGAEDGSIAISAANLTGAVQVSIDGQNASVYYAGAAPTLPNGVFQINVLVPASARSGANVPVSVTISGKTGAQGVTLAIR